MAESAKKRKRIFITGGAGFIGSNFIKAVACSPEVRSHFDFIILDALTYAGHYPSIASEIKKYPHLKFVKIDLRNREKVEKIFAEYSPNGILHFAAESHVDRSIKSPQIFIETNILGTHNLLQSSLKCFERDGTFRYLQVSTDEVYGSLQESEAPFTENSPLSPSGPYSASKASADLLVLAYFKTYGLPAVITRCSNNFGPYQFPEKFIPLMITNAQRNKPLPIYGRGLNVRDWIYVDDHNWGVWMAYLHGRGGEVYNLGGKSERRNIGVAHLILKNLGKDYKLLKFVTDRLGHDFRYAIDYKKAQQEFGWSPRVSFEEGLEKTIVWYTENQRWVKEVQQKSLVKVSKNIKNTKQLKSTRTLRTQPRVMQNQ